MKKKGIVGNIQGGLGNQMFIIFTTISYSLDNDMPYAVKSIERNRKTYFDTPFYKNLTRTNMTIGPGYREKRHSYDPIPICNQLSLHGYFQSSKYFDKNKEKIIKMLEFDVLRKNIGEKYKQYSGSEFDGFLHFRLGDYKKMTMASSYAHGILYKST